MIISVIVKFPVSSSGVKSTAMNAGNCRVLGLQPGSIEKSETKKKANSKHASGAEYNQELVIGIKLPDLRCNFSDLLYLNHLYFSVYS